MRDLIEVVEQIKEEIPDSFKQKKFLIDHLDEVCESYKYSAPEVVPYRWEQISYILGVFLGEPNKKWKQKIVDIFGDKL